jgi:hypothetical protein
VSTAQRIPEFEIDHVQDAIDTLPVAFRTPLILAIVRTFAARWQVVWDAQRTVLDALDLTSTAGETYPFALVPWGVALGQPRRATWTAAVWRKVLLAARVARGSSGSREQILAVVQALTPTGAAAPSVQASPLTVFVHAPGITDPIVQAALRPLLLAAIPDVAELSLSFADEQVLKFDTAGLGFDGGEFA